MSLNISIMTATAPITHTPTNKFESKPLPAFWKPFKSNATNTGVVLQALLQGKRLTVRDVAFDMEILYLSQIVKRLRDHGVPVRTDMMKPLPGPELDTPYAEYYLTASDIAEFYAMQVQQ